MVNEFKLPNKLIKIIALPDIHYPYYERELFKRVLDLIRKEKPDVIVCLGDQLDMRAFNHHEMKKNNRRYMEGKRAKIDYDGFQKEILDKIEQIAPKDCLLIFMLANHEDWGEQYVNEHPEVEGLVEVQNCLDLKNWEVIKNKDYVKLGKLYLHHGDFNGGGKHHASAIVTIGEKSVMYGHNHTCQVHVKTNDIDMESHIAYSIPTLGTCDPEFLRKAANSWVNGLGFAYIDGKTGFFNVYPIISSKGHFVFNGVYY